MSRTRIERGPWAAVLAASLFLAGAVPAAEPAVAGKTVVKAAPAAKTPKAPPAEKKERGEKARFLPPQGSPLSIEGDAIKSHGAWRWHLLTYPKDTVPSTAFTDAQRWVKEHVPDRPWPGKAAALPQRTSGVTLLPDRWTALGPEPLDGSTQTGGYSYGRCAGRFSALALDPRTVSTPGAITAYAGGATGGLWVSRNCCGPDTAWTPLWESFDFVTQAVGAIEIDPTDPDTIYVGTGDFDAYDQFSQGILKTTDGGLTWRHLGADVFVPFAAATPRFANQNIGVIKVDPNNPQNVLVGTRFDLFISHDGGETWTRCPFGANPTDPLNLDQPIGALNRISGIVLDPSTVPTTVYVAVGFTSPAYNGNNGVYKGTIPDSGCPALTLVANGWPQGTGNGTNGATDVGRIRLAASRGNPQGSLTLYAQVQSAGNVNALGTWVTTDGGQSWRMLQGSDDASYKDCMGARTGEGQDWYNLFLLADPQDDKTLYIGRVDLYRATVDPTYTSMTLTDLSNVYSPGCTSYGSLHPDQHCAVWLPGDGAQGRFLLGNDGGVYSADGTAGGFVPLNDTLSTIQWYAGQTGADLAHTPVQYFFGGSQDNGTASWDSGQTGRAWQARGNGGDGFFTAFDPIGGSLTQGNWLYEVYYGGMYRSTQGAAGDYYSVSGPWSSDRNAWSAPFKMDVFHGTATNCKNVVYGSNRLYASVDGGGSWKRVAKKDLTKGQGHVISVDIAMNTPTAVVVGTDDGKVQWSQNAFKGKKCTAANANTANFVCKANDLAKWTDLTGNNAVLPNRAIMGVCFDPTTEYRVYAAVGGFNPNTPATPGHVFQATYSGGSWTWTDKTGNLPDVPANTIVLNPNNPVQAFVGTEMGFYYTNDVTAASPVWYRFMEGLPNTVVQYLALDRGPSGSPYASTTLTAFTYGRGAYAILLPGPTGFPQP